MHLFTVGPVEMRKEIKEIGGQQIPYFRTREFSDLMLESDRLLKKFMNAGSDFESVYLTASGTGAMEAAVMNCLNPKDKVLVIEGGTFGHRFAQLCAIHDIPYNSIQLSAEERLTPNHLKKFDNQGISALLVNINETSTGQLYDVRMLSDFCKRNKAFFIVDAISSFLIDSYNMSENNIDVTIISSQKGLCIAPGLSVIVLSNRILKERVEHSNPKNLYFNFNDYITNFKRGQTPYTPCVGTCLEMYKALQLVDAVGLQQFIKGIASVAEDFRNQVKALPVRLPEFPLGNAVTPIIFDKPIAKQVFKILKDKYGLTVNPTGGSREDYVLRIAHIGNTTKEDNNLLIEKMVLAIAEAEKCND